MKGVVNSNKNIISMMDSTEGSSVNIPVSYNKSGELDMRYSRVMTTDEFDKLGEYVDKENVNNAGKILNGSINIVMLSPYRTTQKWKLARQLCNEYPCVSVDRRVIMLYFVDPKLQPQHYRI